jgi:hypothetical protein
MRNLFRRKPVVNIVQHQFSGSGRLQAADPATPCVLHKDHSPRNETIERHHIIPVAWQLRTQVDNPPFPGKDPDGRGELWDNRSVYFCPTSHRNVHFWIVQLMHAAAAANSNDPAEAIAAVKHGLLPREFLVACDALTRFAAYGSLLNLTAAHEWGES